MSCEGNCPLPLSVFISSRDGPIPVLVSKVSAHWHFFEYRYRQTKIVANTADTVVSAISQVSRTCWKAEKLLYPVSAVLVVSAKASISKNLVSAHP